MICLGCRQKMRTRWGICCVCQRLIAPNWFYAESSKKESAYSQNEWRSLCAVSLYEYPLTYLISQYKMQGKKELAKPLAHLLFCAWYFFSKTEWIQVDAIVAVPLSKKRYLKRGFNQTDLLARYLSKWFNLPYLSNCLIREENAFQQKTLSKNQRQKNMKGAFKLCESIPFKHLLLVDDVVTTGSTAREICRVLKQNGASTIDLLCLARTE